jgi:hypothetical protein
MKTLNNKSQSFKVKNMDSASMPLPSVTTASAQGFLCKIQTFNGHYLTAVGGGGRNYDVIHSDATQARDWEQFRFIELPPGRC